MKTYKYVNKVTVSISPEKNETFISMYQDYPIYNDQGDDVSNMSKLQGQFVMTKEMAQQFAGIISALFNKLENTTENG